MLFLFIELASKTEDRHIESSVEFIAPGRMCRVQKKWTLDLSFSHVEESNRNSNDYPKQI